MFLCQPTQGHSKTLFFCCIPWLHNLPYHQDLLDKLIYISLNVLIIFLSTVEIDIHQIKIYF